MLHEQAGAVADEVDGRLVARHEQQQHHRDELGVRQAVAFLLRGDERGQQVVVARRLAPLVDHAFDELAHVGRGLGGRKAFLGRDQRLERERDRLRPRPQLIAFVGRHAEDLGDDLERERERERRDEVAPAVGRDSIEDLVDHLDDPRSPRLDRLRRERTGGEAPHTRVLRRVDVEKRLVEALVARLALLLVAEQADALGAGVLGDVRTEPRVSQHLGHVVVARQHDETERAAMHGIGGPQLRVVRIRVRSHVGIEGIEEHLCSRHNGMLSRCRVRHEVSAVRALSGDLRRPRPRCRRRGRPRLPRRRARHLAEVTGWDPRTATIIVGTSAGSGVGAVLRAGLPARDLAARITGDPLSPEGAALAPGHGTAVAAAHASGRGRAGPGARGTDAPVSRPRRARGGSDPDARSPRSRRRAVCPRPGWAIGCADCTRSDGPTRRCGSARSA